MIKHIDLGINDEERTKSLVYLIRKGEIRLGGYQKAKIYGRLNCPMGKRMKIENRVFFLDETEAIICGYRPCGHCMREGYKRWKAKQ